MEKIIKYTDAYGKENFLTLYSQPSICPHCSHAVDFILIKCVYNEENNEFNFFLKCKKCNKHSLWITDDSIKTKAFIPPENSVTNLPDSINKLSPDCVSIYKQSQLAEKNQLTMICGMGYRKTLEFLIKDYLIHIYPNEKEAIERELLMQSIKRIQHPQIQTLAERTAWLGNDEAHFVRKHNELDLSDLKRFLDATIKYIDLELTVAEAEQIQKK